MTRSIDKPITPAGAAPEDPPAWRLAFTVLESVRGDGWGSLARLLTLIVLVAISAGGLALCATLLAKAFGYWPVAAGGGMLLAAAGRKRLRRRTSR
jgi:hypothetical protein